MAKTALTDEGHDDLRAAVIARWLYVEIRDELGAAIMRLEIDTDVRCTIADEPASDRVKVTVALKGDDAEITLPETVQYSALYKVAVAGDSMDTAEFTPFTFGNAADELTIEHYIEIPEAP